MCVCIYIRVQNNIIMKKHINVNVNINIDINICIKIIFIGQITLFTILNYAPNYTLYPKLFERTLCILNYHTLHPGVTFAEILLHVTNICFLLMWNKLKRLKHPSSKSIKTKANFSTSLLHAWLSPNSNSCKL